ncbi:MAG: hypothetical protein M1824_001602 [Vezdaea acicularis]|nr:MAG: hypothetical protein M1824_001602 [Vezdaea acicularis]
MASKVEDELAPEQTEGFKVGEKKTMAELTQLDQDDEALRRWKKSLGLDSGESIADPNDPRNVIILSLSLETEGRPDIVVDVSKGDVAKILKENTFKIKEGVTFRMKVKFRVQRELLSGMKYIQVVKRKGIRVAKTQEMLGSYPPNSTVRPHHEAKLAPEEAPSGMLARGLYDAASKFTDDDKITYLAYEWKFEIVKKWDDE